MGAVRWGKRADGPDAVGDEALEVVHPVAEVHDLVLERGALLLIDGAVLLRQHDQPVTPGQGSAR